MLFTVESLGLNIMANQKNKKNKKKMSQADSTTNQSPEVGFERYSLDRYAHDLVFQRKELENEVLNQVHKMRSTVAFGLERFWGEQHRLDGGKSRLLASHVAHLSDDSSRCRNCSTE